MKKLLIAYRNNGAGIGDCLIHAANAWRWAKKNNSKLLIAWYNSIYLKKTGINAFHYFFDFPDRLDGVEIIKEKKSFLKKIIFKWFFYRICPRLRFLRLNKIKLGHFEKVWGQMYYWDQVQVPKKGLKPFLEALKLSS